MTINAIPEEVLYDPQPWIDLAPDYDWSQLIPEPPAPEPEPEPEPEPPTEPEPDPEGGGEEPPEDPA